MATVDKIMSIGIIVISIAAGLIFFYLVSDLSRKKRKLLIEEMVAQLINFIIFIWLGKIILNVFIFIKDPLAILAYPSDSDAFSIALLFSAIVLIYKSKRKEIDVFLLIESFLSVFLVASFLYEFIQLVWNNNTYSLGNLGLFTVLLVLYLLIRDRVPVSKVIIVMLIGFSAGILLLSYIQPFATVFGYIMAPWFVSLFFIISLSTIIYQQRKKDCNGWN
ncbi:hypothetical protein CIL03_09995 [Virgibacillus indicus]|uniref:Uncharacterized protein n=1 Tax=Virgibacillus indicus TaxID=2024554 RepID=A0A265N9Y1_9BACI|nr:hypothetical protein [Virgibacillus indicus]OZU88621.1 hypothetical protein CIL03_09995 [Virgibacillus indicus]